MSESQQSQQDLFEESSSPNEEQISAEPTYRKGKWLKSEENILTSNAQEFLRQNDLTEYSQVFDLPRRDQKVFFEKCAEGINREWELIRRKCLRAFNPLNKLGKYTDKEEQQLMVLYEKYKDEKDQWVMIGEAMGRSNGSVRDKVINVEGNHTKRSTKDKVRKAWTKEEIRLLRDGMKRYKVSENTGCKTQWSLIASYVGTKKARDCMFKWNQLNITENMSNFTTEQEIMLVEHVNRVKANHSTDIDWFLISQQWPYKIDLRVLRRAFNRVVNRYFSGALKASISHGELMDGLMVDFVARVRREAVKFAQVNTTLPDNNEKENNGKENKETVKVLNDSLSESEGELIIKEESEATESEA